MHAFSWGKMALSVFIGILLLIALLREVFSTETNIDSILFKTGISILFSILFVIGFCNHLSEVNLDIIGFIVIAFLLQMLVWWYLRRD